MFLFPIGLVQLLLFIWFAGCAAHFFLVVLNETAQGKNEVDVYWPSDFFLLRLHNAVYLASLLTLCMLPGFFLFQVFDLRSDPTLAGALLVLCAAVGVWLLLPFILLSVLTGGSRWDIIHREVFRRLRGRQRVLLAFYALTAPLVLGGFLVLYLTLGGWEKLYDAAVVAATPWLPEIVVIWSWVFLPPLAAGLCAAALLIYARLVGRLAWLLDLTDGEEPPPKPKEFTPTPASFPLFGETAETPAAPGPDTYGLAEEPEPVAVEPMPISVDPVRLAVLRPRQAEPENRAADPSFIPEPLAALTPPADPEEQKAPRRLLVRGIYRFPWYRASLKAWLFMTLVGLILTLLFRVQLL